MKKPFELHTPSVFVVCSPFQLLCAVAVIRQLEIENYKFILALGKKNNRRMQMINLVKSFYINYEIECVSSIKVMGKRMSALIPRKHGYERLFIGDYRNDIELSYGSQYICDGSDIVNFDDGAATIALLTNSALQQIKWKRKLFFKLVSITRKVELFKNILTIYDNLPNPHYNISYLRLNNALLGNEHKNYVSHGIYIVGTDKSHYARILNEDSFKRGLLCLVRDIKAIYPNDPIIYIPHGRESNEYSADLSNEGCEFRRLDNIIEITLLEYGTIPKAVYGFTSSALYNLKKIFPSSEVVNILYDIKDSQKDKLYSSYLSYIEISNYYERNGILLQRKTL